MADEQGVPVELTEDMRAVLTWISAKLVELLTSGTLDPVMMREKVLELLGGDAGASTLLSMAWAQAVEDTSAEMAQEKLAATGTPGDPHWGDVEIPGLRRMMQKEQHLCARCDRAVVCAVPRAFPQDVELLPVLSRCLAFAEKPG